MRLAYLKKIILSLLLALPLVISVTFFIFDINFTWPIVVYFFHFSLMYACFIPFIWSKPKQLIYNVLGEVTLASIVLAFLFGLILSYFTGPTKLFERQLSEQTYVAIYLNGDQGALGGDDLVACLIKKPFPGIEQDMSCKFEDSFYIEGGQTFVKLAGQVIAIPDKNSLYNLTP